MPCRRPIPRYRLSPDAQKKIRHPQAESAPSDFIEIRGARQNNLKGFDLDLPLGQLNVVTGPSGSGKSSLAFQTIYAEGQRRYVETFSPYTRQFFDRMDKPQVDAHPTASRPPSPSSRRTTSRTTRSTVGTITEINDYLKLLFPPPRHRRLSRVPATESSPTRPQSIAAQARGTLRADSPSSSPSASRCRRKPTPAEFFAFLQHQGYLRVSSSAKSTAPTSPTNTPAETFPAVVHVIQDRVAAGRRTRAPILEAIETRPAISAKDRIAHRRCRQPGRTALAFSTRLALRRVRHRHPPAHARACSASTTRSAPAPTCRGFGRIIGIDLDTRDPRPHPSRIADGVVQALPGRHARECQARPRSARAAPTRHRPRHAPSTTSPKTDQDWVLDGESAAMPEEAWENGEWYGVQGFFDWLETQDLQDARPRLPQPLPHLHQLPRTATAAASSPRPSTSVIAGQRPSPSSGTTRPLALSNLPRDFLPST